MEKCCGHLNSLFDTVLSCVWQKSTGGMARHQTSAKVKLGLAQKRAGRDRPPPNSHASNWARQAAPTKGKNGGERPERKKRARNLKFWPFLTVGGAAALRSNSATLALCSLFCLFHPSGAAGKPTFLALNLNFCRDTAEPNLFFEERVHRVSQPASQPRLALFCSDKPSPEPSESESAATGNSR